MARGTDKTPEEKRPIRPAAPVKRAGKKGRPAGTKKKKSGAVGRAAFAIMVTAAVLALAFFLVMRDQGNISLSENAVGSVFAPIQNAVSSATRYVRDLIQGAKDYVKLTEDYQLAQHEITNLKVELQALEEEARENDRLKDLLEAQERYESMDPVFAYVIARDPGVWFDTFTINRGTQDGIAANMAVVTGDGLVGRVEEVGLNYAKVLSIIDTRSGVACLIERARQFGVMRGQVSAASDTQECYMYYIPAVNNIAPGDVVLTSGEDSVFPKGLKVGTVASVSRQAGSDQYIVVLPSVDFQAIEEVLVLRTVVEQTGEALTPLPTPTPRPTPVPTPTPTPSGGDVPEVDPDSQIWLFPTPLPEGAEPGQNPLTPPTPTPTVDPNGPPEDTWAR